MFLSVNYDIKYQKVARKHMATSRDKKHSRAGSSAHTHLQQLAAAVQPLYTAQQLSAAHEEQHQYQNKKLSQQRAVKTHAQCSSLSECNFSKLDILCG